MIQAIIGLIITLIIVGVIWWAIESLLPLIPLPAQIRQVVHVLLILLLVAIVLWVVLTLLDHAGLGVPFLRRGGLALLH